MFDLREDYIYGIFNREGNRLLGGTGLQTRLGAQQLEIGCWIHKDFVNQGLVTESTAALIKVAFELIHIHRIEIHCDPGNLASAAIPRKLGFTHEGTLRAKNLFLDPGQSITRKLREAAIAVKLERALSKKPILELYLNLIEWGTGIYGAEAAAQSYFHCPASGLTLAQAIFKQTQAGAEFREDDLAGRDAEVITAIPQGGAGEIAVIVKGQREALSARHADGGAIPKGRLVVIDKIAGSTAFVRVKS